MSELDVPYEVDGDLPLRIRPGSAGPDLNALCDWLEANVAWVQEKLTRHGALLFRGFEVDGPEDFERLSRAIDDGLQNDYLGTSPRDSLTDYVFNASELPDYFPIPQHCEMSFIARPPRRLFFCCLVEPAEGSGETPLCDFRKVWRDLDPEVRERFVSRGLRIVRNYAGPQQGDSADAMQLKGWDEMFQSTDHAVVEARCKEENFEPTWLPENALRLTHTQPVFRDHPVTSERVWHNHLTTFHLTTAASEYQRIAAMRPTERHQGVLKLARELEKGLREKPPEDQSMHTTYLDGSQIPDSDLEAVRDTVWKHLVVEPWRRGDVVAIDNHSTSHGRLPYEGPRHIAVCWA